MVPLNLHATEAKSLRSLTETLNDCIRRTIVKIFKIQDDNKC